MQHESASEAVERELIGVLLQEPDAPHVVQRALNGFEFSTAAHDCMVMAILAEARAGNRITPAAIAIRLSAANTHNTEESTLGYLSACSAAAPALSANTLEPYIAGTFRKLREARAGEIRRQGDSLLREAGIDALPDVLDLLRETHQTTIVATPFRWTAPEDIPTRKFLFASRHAIGSHASVTGAPGGTGKSSLVVTECLSHCTGRNLLNDAPLFRGRAWLLGLEDALEEHQRRVAATVLLHKIEPNEFEGRFFLDDAHQDFVIARQGRDGTMIAEPIVAGIIDRIKALQISLLCVDPFVASHGVPENDNGAIDTVARLWVRVARETGAAVELVHHLRKGNGAEPSADDFRGASALVPAVRSARLLAAMEQVEAERLGITERFRYFRTIDAKKNMAARSTETPWREIVAIDLRNGSPSDHVAAITAWTPPSPTDAASIEQLDEIKAKVRAGQWRENAQATAWVGNPVAEVLGLDLHAAAARATVQRAVRQWTRDGVFKVIDGKDECRKLCKFVTVA